MPRRRRLRLPSEVLGAPAWAGTCAISASPLPVTRPGQRRPCRAGRCPASNTGRKTQIGARPSLPSGRVCACRMPFPRRPLGWPLAAAFAPAPAPGQVLRGADAGTELRVRRASGETPRRVLPTCKSLSYRGQHSDSITGVPK